MSKEKKKMIKFTAILTIIALALIAVLVVGELRNSGVIGSSESKEIMEKFNKEFKSKERTVIYYASSGCSYCELQAPILETIAEDYDMDYFEIDSIELSKTQREEVLEKLEIEHATPTTVIVENGKVISTAVGYTPGNEYVEFFKDAEMLPEDAIYSPEKNITYIDYSEYETLIDSDETNIIVIGQTTCSNCIAIKPALNSVAGDYDLTINYLDLDGLTNDESTLFFESLETIEYNDEDYLEDGSIGTPLTLIVEDGKVKDYIVGSRTTSQLVREFKKQGLISE